METRDQNRVENVLPAQYFFLCERRCFLSNEVLKMQYAAHHTHKFNNEHHTRQQALPRSQLHYIVIQLHSKTEIKPVFVAWRCLNKLSDFFFFKYRPYIFFSKSRKRCKQLPQLKGRIKPPGQMQCFKAKIIIVLKNEWNYNHNISLSKIRIT